MFIFGMVFGIGVCVYGVSLYILCNFWAYAIFTHMMVLAFCLIPCNLLGYHSTFDLIVTENSHTNEEKKKIQAK